MPLPKIFEGRLSLPVIAAPMFLVSNVELVQATCSQRVVGTFPALNARTSEALDEWLTALNQRLDPQAAPFGVNLIVHRTNQRLENDLAILEKHRVPLVITSLGAVRDVVDRVHGWGGIVFHDVIHVKHARKAAEANVDGLIAVAAGAGGHGGTVNPFSLVAEIREFFDKTLILAGCLNHGAQVLASLAMGADLAYLGTRFIATRESGAPDDYKKMILSSTAADIIYTPAVSGVPANFMRSSLEQAGYDEKLLRSQGQVDFYEKLKPLNEEAKAWKTVWSAGQGVGTIHDVPSVAELCSRLTSEFRATREALPRFS